MLGTIIHRPIDCGVKNCRHNRKHEVYGGDDRELLEIYYRCAKEHIEIKANGKCTEA